MSKKDEKQKCTPPPKEKKSVSGKGKALGKTLGKMPDMSGISKQLDNYKNELNKIQKELMDKVKNINLDQMKNELINKIKNIKPDQVKDILSSSLNNAKDYVIAMCDPAKRKAMADKQGPSRPMKYPYTFSAKIAQFPLQHYAKNQWIWKYYFASLAICLPVFYSINKLANSPGNVAKWAEIRRKEAAEHHH